jgi:hypothetical protein
MAWDFDSGDYLFRNDIALRLLGSEASVHLWTQPDSTCFFGVWGNSRCWLLSWGPSAKLNIQIDNGGVFSSSANLPASGWSSVGWSFGSAKNVYLNGVKTTTTNQHPTTNGSQFEMGRAANVVYSDGRMDHATIWDVQLTDAEFAALAAGAHPFGVRPASLIAYWPLWIGTGGNSIDLSGSGRPLASAGTPTAYAAGGAPVAFPFPA